MKRNTLPAALVTVFCVVVVAGFTPALLADQQCSDRSVSGKWGFRLSGSFLTDPTSSPNYPNDEPWAGTGTFSLDRSGNITGAGFLHASPMTFSGTYTVDADCSGSLVIDVITDGEDQGLVHFSLVFVDNSREVHWSSTEPEFVINIDGKKLFSD